MAKIVGLRGIDGLGDDAAAPIDPTTIPLPPPPPARPPITLAGTVMLVGSVGLVGYLFWATIQKPKRGAFVRNGKRFYRKKRR